MTREPVLSATLLVGVILVAAPYCGMLFRCGCSWPWAGLTSPRRNRGASPYLYDRRLADRCNDRLSLAGMRPLRHRSQRPLARNLRASATWANGQKGPA